MRYAAFGRRIGIRRYACLIRKSGVPEMDVSVNKARSSDHACAIEDAFGLSGITGSDFGNLAVTNQNIGLKVPAAAWINDTSVFQ